MLEFFFSFRSVLASFQNSLTAGKVDKLLIQPCSIHHHTLTVSSDAVVFVLVMMWGLYV